MTLVLMLFAFIFIGILKPSIANDKTDNLAEAIFEYSRNYKFINNVELFLCSNSSTLIRGREIEIEIAKMLMANKFYLNVKLIDVVTNATSIDVLATKLSSIRNSPNRIMIIIDNDCASGPVVLKLVRNHF